MYKNVVQPERPQMKMWCTRIAFWIPKATNTLKIRNIYCFLLQRWLHEHVSILRFTYIACLV